MSIDTFQYDKKTVFASRLFSIAITETNRRQRKKLIESIAKEQKMDLIVSIDTDPPQILMAEAAAGYKKDMVAVSAMVSEKLATDNIKDFISVILLGNGNYLITIQKEGVLSHDFIGTLSDATTIVNNEYSQNSLSWQKIFLPHMMETIETIYNREEIDLDYFIPKNKKGKPDFKKYRLKPVSTKLITPKRLILIMLIGGVLWGGNEAWEQYQQHKMDQEMLANQQAEKQRIAASVIRIDNPWKKQPLPGEFIQACKTAYSGFNLWTGGWMLSEITCTQSSVLFKWLRKPDGFLAQIRNTYPNAKIDPDGNSATLSIRIKPQTGIEEKVPDGKEVKLKMLSKAQFHKINIKIGNPSAPSLPEQDPKAPAPIYNFNQIQWSVETASPELIAGIFNEAGFRITKMFAKINESADIKWTVQGMQYVKKP